MPAYTNPGFLVDHLFRYSGQLIAGPEAAGFPLSALVDGRNLGLWQGLDGTIAEDVVFSTQETNVVANRPAPTRIIVPSSHEAFLNWQRVQIFKGVGSVPTTVVTLSDGTAADLHAAPNFNDYELAEPIETVRTRLSFFGAPTSVTPHQAGEAFASRRLTTSSGVVQTWADGDVPNAFVTTTSSGNVYANERGQPRRVWRMEYQRIDEDDARVLDTVRRLAGLQTRTFWFDPPDSGDRSVRWPYLEDPSPDGVWGVEANSFYAIQTDANSNPPNVEPWLNVAWTGTGPGVTLVHFTWNEPQDLTDKLLQIDAWSQNANSNQQENNLIGFGDAPGVSGNLVFFRNLTWERYGIDAAWRRIYIDPTLSPPATNGTTRDAVDFRAVRSLVFRNEAQAQLNASRYSQPRLISKSKRAMPVELLEFDKRQSSKNPGARIAYDVTMTVREVLS